MKLTYADHSQPLVTSLLVFSDRLSKRNPDISKEGLLTGLMSPTSKSDTPPPVSRVMEAIAISAVSLFALMVLPNNYQSQSFWFRMASAFAWTAIFSALKSSRDTFATGGGSVNEIVLGSRLAWRVAVLLNVVCVLYPIFAVSEPLDWSIVPQGLLSASQWALFFTIVSVFPY
jgi:hypothetical protein